MTPLMIGALLAIAALVWVIAPIFEDAGSSRSRETTEADEAAAEAEIRKWREPKS
ncbi:MAG TPA: hypothetical protein VGN65_14905 [Casimicrobiaceae bacterium]